MNVYLDMCMYSMHIFGSDDQLRDLIYFMYMSMYVCGMCIPCPLTITAI